MPCMHAFVVMVVADGSTEDNAFKRIRRNFFGRYALSGLANIDIRLWLPIDLESFRQ